MGLKPEEVSFFSRTRGLTNDYLTFCFGFDIGFGIGPNKNREHKFVRFHLAGGRTCFI